MNSKKITVVIRNKNEATSLRRVLECLSLFYLPDIKEIIVVDNNSTDHSHTVSKKYGCRIVHLDNFSYGRASNLGIQEADTEYVLLLSSHALPVGNNFFKNSIEVLDRDKTIAGLRYINSFENYERALKENFVVKDPLSFGLMAACCMVNRNVWKKIKFNEDLLALEDKEWSKRTIEKGYKIVDMNETFFYFLKRSSESNRNRQKIEAISYYELQQKSYPSPLRTTAFFLKKITIINLLNYTKTIIDDLKNLYVTYKVHNYLKKKKVTTNK